MPTGPTAVIAKNNMFENAGFLLLRPDVWYVNLTQLHPSPVQIFQLWQKFVDNVNPLVKILHIPTVQKSILSASEDLASMSKQTEALMFSIYSLAVMSTTDIECTSMMAEPRSTLLSRYQNAAKEALIALDWIKSANLVILQAFVLFLISTRPSCDLQTFSILTGTCVRIAQRLGLHSEKRLAHYSAFDAEMCRRLWWQIGILESKSADLAGVSNMAAIELFDTKLPANLNDCDLSLQMSQLPMEHTGATEMVFCLLRSYVGEFQRICPLLDGTWEMLVRNDIPLDNKYKVVFELEKLLQSKVLRHLDPGIPLHQLTKGAALSFVDRLRLLCLHPRLYQDRQAGIRSIDRETLFDVCLAMVQRDNQGHSLPGVQGYRWHIDSQFQLDPFIYLLHELQSQCTGRRADAAWPQILEVLEHHPEVLQATGNPLWVAVGNLTLKSWTARERALTAQHQFRHPATSSEETLPRAISILHAKRVCPSKIVHAHEAGCRPNSFPPSFNLGTADNTHQGFQNDGVENSFTGLNGSIASNCDPAAGMDMVGPIDWMYWNSLVQESEMLPYES